MSGFTIVYVRAVLIFPDIGRAVLFLLRIVENTIGAVGSEKSYGIKFGVDLRLWMELVDSGLLRDANFVP